MKILTQDAVLHCTHDTGIVGITTSQSYVRIENRKILVANDPQGRPIAGCPNVGPSIVPCTATLKVEKGYSDFVFVDGNKVCLETVTGKTNGTPPGTVKYKVRKTGQNLVEITQ